MPSTKRVVFTTKVAPEILAELRQRSVSQHKNLYEVIEGVLTAGLSAVPAKSEKKGAAR